MPRPPYPVRERLGSDSHVADQDGQQWVVKRFPALGQAPIWLHHVRDAFAEDVPEQVVPLADVRVEGGDVYLVRRFITGKTLAAVLEKGPMPVVHALDVAIDITTALAAAHERGVIHGDLKPSNIILSTGSGPGAAHVAEFGVFGIREPLADRSLASSRYLSPEQAGLLEHEVGEWSDLYSLGIVLYGCLTGQPPFAAKTLGALLRQHLNDTPPALRSLGIDVPVELEDIVRRLLRKDPRERYRSAGGLLHDLLAVREGVRSQGRPALVVGAADRRDSLTEPAFHGRVEDLQALDQELAAARKGQARFAFIDGESGGGKSRLLQEFSFRAQLAQAWVLRGQGRDQVAPRPFGLLEDVGDALRRLDDVHPDDAAALREALGDDLPVLVQSMPGLADWSDTRKDTGLEEHGEERTIRAMTHLLSSLGTADRPAVLLLDDVQWSDLPTRRLLDSWWRAAREAPCHVLIVAAFRTEEVGADDPLRKIDVSCHRRLSRFEDDDILALVRSMAGRLPREAEDLTVRLADGNPFMASAALRGLVESGDLVPGSKGWRWEGEAGLAVDVAMADFLVRRVSTLPAATRRLLEVAAVLGKQFDIEVAAELAGLEAHAAWRALTEARNRHILARSEQENEFLFTHDKLREAVLGDMDTARRTALHDRAARQLRATRENLVFDLAYHYDAAGEADQAAPFALSAAAQARSRFALDVAERYYRIAERGTHDATAAQRFEALHGLGETLMLQGAYDEAAPWLEKASVQAQTKHEQAALLGRIGELFFKQGDLERASKALEKALRLVGHPAPSSRAGAALRLPKELLIQILHSVAPRLFLHRKSGPRMEQDMLAARLYSDLAHVNWFLRGVPATAWAHLREMNIAERYPPSEQLGQAYAEHTVVMTTVPLHRRGDEYGRRSLEMRRELGQTWGQGHAHHFHGLGLLAAGRLEDALASVQEAARIFDRTGDLWQANNCGWNIARILHRLGRDDEAQAAGRRTFEQADRIGDLQNTGLALEAWVKAGGEGVTWAMLEDEYARCPKGDVQTTEAVLQAQGVWHLQQGDSASATAAFAKAEKVARQGGLRSEYVAPIPAWLATALRQRLDALPLWAPERKRLHRDQVRAVRRSLRQARKYPCNRPHAWREAAYVAAVAGRPRRAQKALERSENEAVRLGMQGEVRATTRARGAIGAAFGWRGAEVVQPAARSAPRPASLALAERFSRLIEVGRDLATSTSHEEAAQRLTEVVPELLGGDDVVCVAVDEVARLRPAVAALAKAAILEGAPQVFDADHADPDHGLARAGLRSALAFPVTERGQPHLCVVATHREVSGLYNDDSVGLARFLSALAGAALENVAGYRQIEDAHKRMAYQATLLESQAEAMIEGMLLVDPDGKIVSHNRRFAEMWDLPMDALTDMDDDEAIGRVLDQVQDPDQFQARIKALYQHPDEVGHDEIRLRDGRVFERDTAPVRGADGTFYGRVWWFRDITERQRYEQGLRDAYERLRDVDRMKTAFINTAAHELNTPLTPIRLQLALLRQAVDGETEGRSLDVLERNFVRLQTLVQDIMDTARIEGNRLRIAPQPSDLRPLLEEVLASYAGWAAKEGVELALEAEESMPVVADPKRIAQVLDNLVANAIRFTPRGGRVDLVGRRKGDHWTVRVRDSGLGLRRDQIGELFVPFNQPVDAPDGRHAGTGLGLVICKGIVERHGGEIWAESAGPGKGATFSFLLPAGGPPGDERISDPRSVETLK